MVLTSDYPKLTRGRIVVWGFMSNMPFGGMIWQVYHYIVPLRKLGFDVWYVEDTDSNSFDPVTHAATSDPISNVQLLSEMMKSIGLPDRWFVRKPCSNEIYGKGNYSDLMRLYREADFAINLCGAQEPRESHNMINCRIYIETDPVQNQVAVANGDQDTIKMLENFDHLFTYGENIGTNDCPVPVERFHWRVTRPPVCKEWWETNKKPADDAPLRSITSWKFEGKDVVWKGEVWRWSKHYEFLKFIDLPINSKLPLELSISEISQEDLQRLIKKGWQILTAHNLNDPDTYRQYIQNSLGEFTVAKEQYVKPRSGWFSDRSVCYLAAGRPVITQCTGFEKKIPTGDGLFSYSDMEGALSAIEAISSDYEKHSKAASDIAHEYFDAEKVISEMLEEINLI